MSIAKVQSKGILELEELSQAVGKPIQYDQRSRKLYVVYKVFIGSPQEKEILHWYEVK